MKKHNLTLASLLLLCATDAAISMEAPQPQKLIVRTIAWGYSLTNPKGWDYYVIKVAPNNSENWIPENGLEEGARLELGNLSDINQIKIRRSGWGSSVTSVSISTITAKELNEIREEAKENIGKDVVLAIGTAGTGFGLSSHHWVPSGKKEQILPEYQKTIYSFLQNYKDPAATENNKITIEFILKRDTTKDKRFQKRLADAIQLYTAKKIPLKTFEDSIGTILRDVKRFKVLPIK